MSAPTIGRLTTRDGLRLAYDEAGAGPTVLFVHGLGLNRRRWQHQFDAAVASGFRAVRFDLRGFGESDMPRGPYEMTDLVDDLARVVEELVPRPFHLVGHSLGGMLSQAYAVDHPDELSSLTVASTTAHNGRRASAFAKGLSMISERGFDAAVTDPEVRGLVEEVLAEAFPAGTPPIEYFRRGLEDPNPAHAYAWRTCVGFSVKDRLQSIRCPVLVLHGAADPIIPVQLGRWIAETLPQSRWVVFEGAGHSIQVERAGEFTGELVPHLQAAG